MRWDAVKPKPKVAAGGAAWGVAVILVAALEGVTSFDVGEVETLAFTASVAAVAAWLMPDVPPWKRDDVA